MLGMVCERKLRLNMVKSKSWRCSRIGDARGNPVRVNRVPLMG